MYREFCHSTEQGTVWDNTYEEHDSILKGSFAIDQSTKVDSRESASKVPSEDDHIDIGIETSSSHINDSNLTCSQPYTSAVEVPENDKDDLNFTNPVEYVEIFSQELPLGKTILPNAPESTSDIAVTIYTNKDKENCASSICNEYYSKVHTSNVNSGLDRTCVQDVSMEFTMMIPQYHASSIPVYSDVKDGKQENVQKDNVASHHGDFNTNCTMEITKVVSWENKARTFVPTSKQQENLYERNDINNSFTEKTKLLLKSMEITEAVSVPLCQEKMYNIKHTTKSLISNCNNESLEITQAVPTSVEPIKSDIEAFKKVPVIVQNYEDARCDAPNNSMVLSTNLQSTENIVSSQIHDVNCSSSHLMPDNNMKLTNVIRSYVADSDTDNMNNDENDINLNISMEMTTALPSKIYEKNAIPSCNKSATKEDNLRKSWENTEHINKTEFFKDVPMEMTRSINLYERNILYPNSEDTVAGKKLQKNKETNENSDGTELFNDAAMQMTRPINVMLPTSVYEKENLRIDETMLRDDRNMFSHNTSMEMTKIESRNGEEMFNSIIHEENEYERKNMNNSMTSSERTKLLCKSMNIIEAVPNSLLREKTRNKECNIENTAELTETVVSHTTTTPKAHLPREDSAESSLQTDPFVNNDEVSNVLIKIDTAAIQSTMRNMEDITLNGVENLGVSKSNEFQCLIVNNTVEFKKSETRENVTISRETVETTNLHNTSSNTSALTNNFNHSSAALTNTSRKRLSHENENTNTKKFRSDSFVESQPSVYDNKHSSSKTDEKYLSNKCLTEDTTDSTRISALPCGSTDGDSLNKIDECSFLRKNLENSLMELQSINPPSFIYMSSEEEVSFPELVWENKLHTSITTDAVSINNKNNSSERLEPINIEHHKTEDCHRSIVTNAIENNRETDCQAIETTITDDYRVDESNRYATDVEHLDGQNLLSTSNVGRRKTMTLSTTNHFTKTNVTREDQIDREEGEEINDEVELRNIEQKEHCSEIGKEEERCIDSLKEIEGAIKDQVDQDEYCQENLDDKVNPQGVEQKEDRVEERLDAEQDVNRSEEEEPSVEQDPFLSLSQKLEAYAEK